MCWRAFIRLGRPRYLFKSALLYGLGASAAVFAHHRIAIGWYLIGQIFVSCVHLMTHYCNEFFDLEADRANRDRAGVTGGSRVLVDGVLAPEVSLGAGFVLLFLAAALLLAMPSGAARWLCLAILGLGWFYTAPPLKLNHRCLGELCSMVVIDLLCPALAFYLQAGRLDSILFMVVVPNCIFQYSYMMMMNFFDYEGDRAVGKKTLVVVVGRATAARLYIWSHVLAYGSVLVLWWAGLPSSVALCIGLTLPYSIWLCRRIHRGARGGDLSKDRTAWSASAFTMVAGVVTNVGLLVGAPIEWNRLHGAPGLALCAMVPLVCAGWLVSDMWTNLRLSRRTS